MSQDAKQTDADNAKWLLAFYSALGGFAPHCEPDAIAARAAQVADAALAEIKRRGL